MKSSVYLILTPDGMTAEEFAHSETGMEWIGLADSDDDPFAVAFVEPENGGTWNLSQTPDNAGDGRDEVAGAFAVYSAVRDKAAVSNAFLSVDKSGVRLVGYEEGASAAALWAASWPQLFANLTLINPTVPASNAEAWLDEYIFPVAIDSSKGYELHMSGREVAMPLFIYEDEGEYADGYIDLYSTINENAVNPDATRDRSLEVAKVLRNDAPATIYHNAKQNNRFLGYPGGTIRAVFGAYGKDGFNPVWEDRTIDGYTRRWMVYVPESYDESVAVPLVVAMHGSSASITDLPEESRWTDLADEYGFIVVFVQGYPVGDPNPIPSWYSLEGGAQTDIDYIMAVVEKVQTEYNIDESKRYLTGHSMGSMMTQCFAASDDRAFFAAYGPVGYALAGDDVVSKFPAASVDETNTVVIPMWFHKGEWDLNGNKIDGTEGGDTEALVFWAETVGNLDAENRGTPVDENDADPVRYDDGKYLTTTYTDENGIPVVRYTQVTASPHTYMPQEAQLLWSWFDCWSRTPDGDAVYTPEGGEHVVVTIDR